ncbi:MAG TPA: aquaporin [Pirellulales bacterium]|jgi:aquaporin Z
MNKLVTEFIGTFFLFLTIGCSVLAGAGGGVIPPLAIGSALMVMIFAGGHISGAHYNPAVTLGALLRGRTTVPEAIGYWVVQILGAGAAAAAVKFLRPDAVAAIEYSAIATGPAFLAEFLFTFALVYVVLNVATSKDTAGNSFYGLAIGFTVLTGAFAVGDISRGAFNPAVAVGLWRLGIASVNDLGLYFLANLAGGAVAAIVFRVLNPNDS